MTMVTDEKRLVELSMFLRTANLYALQSTQINRAIALAEEKYDEIYKYIWAESYYCFLLCAAKLFDSAGGSLSIEKLIKNVEVAKYRDEKASLQDTFASLKKRHIQVVRRIIKIRNEAIAHIDEMLVEGNEDHQLEMMEVERLLVETMDFLDSLPWIKESPYEYQGSYSVQKILGLEPKKQLIQQILMDYKRNGLI